MKSIIASKLGTLGKSFVAPGVAAATIGAVLLADSTSDTAQISWSPSAAALLPDTLPAVGTLLSYGGSRQLAAGGTVSHSGALTLNGAVNFQNGSGVTYAGWTGSGRIFYAGGDAFAVRTSTGGTYLFNAGFLAVTNSTDASSATADTFLSRESAGVWRMGTTSTGSDAGLKCGAITASGTVNVTPKVEVIFSGTTPATPAYGSIALVGTTFSASPYIGGGLCSDRLQGLWFPDGVPVMGTRTSLAAGATFTPWLVFASTIGVGGQTSSFPGFNASGTTFRIRLADNSADAPLSAGAITASGAIVGVGTIGNSATVSAMDGFDFSTTAGTVLIRQGGSRWIGFKSIGTVFSNAGGIGFAANGSASAFTSVVYEVSNGWRLQADNGLSIRNLANSADAPLTCGAITASGAVMETPTQSTINPTTVNIPTGQRRGWYNSTLAEFRDWVNIGGTLLKSAAYT